MRCMRILNNCFVILKYSQNHILELVMYNKAFFFNRIFHYRCIKLLILKKKSSISCPLQNYKEGKDTFFY